MIVLGVGRAGDSGGVGGCTVVEVIELTFETGAGAIISAVAILSRCFLCLTGDVFNATRLEVPRGEIYDEIS